MSSATSELKPKHRLLLILSPSVVAIALLLVLVQHWPNSFVIRKLVQEGGGDPFDLYAIALVVAGALGVAVSDLQVNIGLERSQYPLLRLLSLLIRLPIGAVVGALSYFLVRFLVSGEEGITVLNNVLVGIAGMTGFATDRILQNIASRLSRMPLTRKPPQGATPAATSDANSRATFDSRHDEVLEEMVRLDPTNTIAARELIRHRLAAERYEAAAEAYDALISLEPTNAGLIREKAELYQKLGDHRRYVETLERAERLTAGSSFDQNAGAEIELRQLEVRDVAFFADFKWPLRPKVNVLLGNNGYGKSHLLRLLVAMIQNEKEVTGQFFDGAGRGATVQLDISRQDQIESSIRRIVVFEKSFGKIPVLAIPDVRSFDRSGDSIGVPRDEVSDLRQQGARDFLQNRSFEARICAFLYEICFDYMEAGKKFSNPVFSLLEESFQKLSGGNLRFHEIIRRDNARFDIKVFTEGNDEKPLSLQKVSQGTLSLLAMVGITYQFLRATHPDVPEAEVQRQKGVVIIDEIDAHLHPTWQQKVLQLFRDTFPNVQFIVTAHSPLVIAGCLEGEVAVLEKSDKGFLVNVKTDEHFIGATAEDIYRRIFRVVNKDATYNRLGSVPEDEKNRLQNLVQKLGQRENVSDEEQAKLEAAKDGLYYLQRFKEVQEKERQKQDSEQHQRKFQLEIARLQGDVASLENKLKEKQERASDSTLQPDKYFAELLSSAPSHVKTVAQYLALRGHYSDAAVLREAIGLEKNTGLEDLLELASWHESARSYREAAKVLRRAAALDKSNTEVRSHLARVEGLAGKT